MCLQWVSCPPNKHPNKGINGESKQNQHKFFDIFGKTEGCKITTLNCFWQFTSHLHSTQTQWNNLSWKKETNNFCVINLVKNREEIRSKFRTTWYQKQQKYELQCRDQWNNIMFVCLDKCWPACAKWYIEWCG